MIKDKNVSWARKRLYIPAQAMAGSGTAATGPAHLHTGGVTLNEISTFGLAAARLEASSDVIVDARPLPVDFDIDYPMYLRIYWSTDSATTTDGVTLRIRYNAKTDGEVLTDGAVSTLDTAITEDTVAGQYYLHKTAWGVINADTFADGDLFIMEIMCTATDVTIASEYVFILGYEMEYTPKRTYDDQSGQGMRHEAQRAYTA